MLGNVCHTAMWVLVLISTFLNFYRLTLIILNIKCIKRGLSSSYVNQLPNYQNLTQNKLQSHTQTNELRENPGPFEPTSQKLQ